MKFDKMKRYFKKSKNLSDDDVRLLVKHDLIFQTVFFLNVVCYTNRLPKYFPVIILNV